MGGRDDTVPKTVDTRRHCEVGVQSIQQSSTTPSLHLWLLGLLSTLPRSAFLGVYSFWNSVTPVTHLRFLHLYSLKNISSSRLVVSYMAIYVSIRLCIVVLQELQVLVKVPARVLYGNYWARGKFEKVM